MGTGFNLVSSLLALIHLGYAPTRNILAYIYGFRHFAHLLPARRKTPSLVKIRIRIKKMFIYLNLLLSLQGLKKTMAVFTLFYIFYLTNFYVTNQMFASTHDYYKMCIF